MIEVREHPVFTKWRLSLRDELIARRIAVRLTRIEAGLMGDVKYFGGMGEIRIDYGPGYRLYFVKRGNTLVILLCGGDKDSQRRDIELAKNLAKEV
jgi:putative addiction module killer protein